MKIILVSRGDPSTAFAGTEILAGNLVTELAKAGHEVCLVYGVDGVSKLSFQENTRLYGVSVIHVPFLSAFDFRRKCAKQCAKLLDEGNFDAVVALGVGTFPGYIFGKLKRKSSGASLIFYAMDSMIMEYKRSRSFGTAGGLLSRFKMWIWYFGLIRSDKLSCLNSDLVLASSKDTILHLVDDYGVLPQKIKLLYEGIPDDFADGVTITDPELPTFLHIGGGPRKGTVFFLEALKRLQEKYGLKAKGVITRSDSSITKKAEELKINVETHKYVSNQELKQLFASCTALVSPSLSEGFCLPVVEAMFFGKPSIVTNVGSLPELVSDDLNGFISNVGDTIELSENMYKIAIDSALRQRLSHQSRLDSKNFGLSKMMGTLLDELSDEKSKKIASHLKVC